MKKKIIIAVIVLVIYTAAFIVGQNMYYDNKDKTALEKYTEAFSAALEETCGKDEYQHLDFDYVRSDYELNSRGEKHIHPTVYFESTQFSSLSDEEKIEFFYSVECDLSLRSVDANSNGHGGLHILSGGSEYACEVLGFGEGNLYKDGKVIVQGSFLYAAGDWEYGREFPAIYFLIGLIAIGVIVIPPIIKQSARDKKSNEKKAFLDAINNHTWEFPVKDFHTKCKEQGITDTNTAFSRKKVENIAKSILTEAGVPEEAQGWYLQRAAKYYNDESSRIVNEAAAEEKQWKTTLHTASSSDWNHHKFEKAEKAKNMYGTQKREYLLSREVESLRSLLGYSQEKHFKPALQKEKDWAVHGGIAQGIAGPAAGAVTAMNVMRENEKIREQNAQMMQVSAIVNRQRYADEARYRKEIKEYEEELRVLPEKVVFDNISTDEILSAFQISVKEISRYNERNEGCMNVWLSIKQTRSLNLDIPTDAKIVLDGTICGKVFTAKEQPNSECPGGVEVGEFVASIDMYGIPYYNGLRDGITLEARSVQGYCSRFYGDINTKYVCKLTGKPNLWLMER